MNDTLKHGFAVITFDHRFDQIVHELDNDLLLQPKELFNFVEDLNLAPLIG